MSELPKICFFNSLLFWGGGEKLHLENALSFREMGYDVFLLVRTNSVLHKKATEYQLKVYNLKFSPLSYLNPFAIFKVARILKSLDCNTIIMTTSQDMKIGSFASLIAKTVRVVYLRGLATPVKARLLNRFLFKRVLTHIIANSVATKNTMMQYLKKYVDADKVKIIYHGIKTKTVIATPKDKLPIILQKSKGIRIGNAGRLTKQKGQLDLIKLALELKKSNVDFTIFIAGSGELEDELKREIQTHHLEKDIILLGFVGDMDSFMNSIDLFVLTSKWEGFGFVLVEAMIRAKPVIAYDISSNPEIIRDNYCGYLVPAGDIQEMTSKLKTLINNDDLRLKMGLNALEHVKENFDLDIRAKELAEFILY